MYRRYGRRAFPAPLLSPSFSACFLSFFGWKFFACRDDARLSLVVDDNDTTVCLDDHYRDFPDKIYVDISMDIDGSPPACPRSLVQKKDTLPLLSIIRRFDRRRLACKERAKETRGKFTGLTAWSNFDTD